jgi:hypothetical protein
LSRQRNIVDDLRANRGEATERGQRLAADGEHLAVRRNDALVA